MNGWWLKAELADLVLLIFIAAFVRQYLWFAGNSFAAWSMVVLLTLVLWILHLQTKPVEAGPPTVFWLQVGIPLLFFYTLRVALPDMSWDVLDYRIINGELGLAGWPIRALDFFPSRFPFNPAPDMVMGIARRLLGYRLGTIVNLAALLWTGTILEKLFRPWLLRVWPRCMAVLVLLLTEHLLFQINNYMVDVIALPLMLEALRLALMVPENARYHFARIGFYLGAATAFKLTNIAFATPILLLIAYRMWTSIRDSRAAIYGVIALLLPLVPYSVFMYLQTDNPVFPLFNGIFKSAYWPAHDLRPERWGPVVDDPTYNSLNLWERMIWPLLLPFRVAHTAGDLGPHWGRITIAFLASLAALFLRKIDRSIRMMAFVTVVGSIIWSLASGMLRYAGFIEVVGGVVAIYLISVLVGSIRDLNRQAGVLSRVAGVLVAAVLVAQSASSCVYAFNFEWGSRSNIVHQPREHLYEARFILSDRSLARFLSAEDKAMFERIKVWVESAPMTGGVQTLLRPEAPLWCVYMDELLNSDQAKTLLAQRREYAKEQPAYSLTLIDWLPFAREKLSRHGFEIANVKIVSLPYYSDRARFHNLLLMELLPPGQRSSFKFDVTALQQPLNEGGSKAELNWVGSAITQMRSGERRTVRVVVKNSSSSTWPALGRPDGSYRILLGNHWLDAAGRIVVNDDARMALPYDLVAGDQVELPLDVTAPSVNGTYILEIDLVQENVNWLASKGSKTLRATLVVAD